MSTIYQVIRTHFSPYQSQDFSSLEEKAISEFAELTYRKLEDFKPDFPSILITNTHTQLSKLNPELLKYTKLIIHPNSGYDNFVTDLSKIESIPVIIGHEIRAQAVSEYILAALFEGIAELPQHLIWDKSRIWNRPLIKDLKILIVGYGHIGKIVSRTLSALGADLTIIDPYQKSPFRHFKHIKEAALEDANVIISCCSLNEQTKHYFNQTFFDRCQSEIIFINPARGKLVDEKALKNFLAHNPKAFAFLDVFEKEPFEDEWLHHPQVWKTSHIAGVYKHLDKGILDFELKALRDFLSLESVQFKNKYQDELLQNKYFNGDLI